MLARSHPLLRLRRGARLRLKCPLPAGFGTWLDAAGRPCAPSPLLLAGWARAGRPWEFVARAPAHALVTPLPDWPGQPRLRLCVPAEAFATLFAAAAA
ncbi:hypothetical protein [Plasticicumulans sp.]|uniref:hypothetical protein n=1 Tax=Plasticicumulans sp. TaxID=2307179 RepID=UPI00393CBCC8